MHLRKKNILIIMTLAMSMIMATAIGVFAVSVKNATGKVNAVDGLNIRKTASTTADIVASVEDDTKLTIKSVIFKKKTSTKASTKWYKVSCDGKTGYVRSDFVDSIKYKTVQAKTTAKVTYRVGAGTKMTSKGNIKKGTTVKVYLKATPVSATAGSSKIWYMINVGGKKYYACSKNFKLVESEPQTDGSDTEKADKNKDKTKDKDKEEDKNKPQFKCSDVKKPSTLTVGESYEISGTVTCEKKIGRVQVGIQDADGDWMEHPYSNIYDEGVTQFDVSAADSYVKFGIIAPGKYKYVIICYVDNVSYKVVNRSFTVSAGSSILSEETIATRLEELKTALKGHYFTSDNKACNDSVGDTCSVENILGINSENTIVKELLLTNKGGERLNVALMPTHYGPSGESLSRGWSCCGFGGFAGWYIGADTITDDVNNVIVKMGCEYNKANMQKYAKPGDIIRGDSSHTFVLLSAGDSECTVLDSNWNHDCKVTVHTIPYTNYNAVTISRCSRCS